MALGNIQWPVFLPSGPFWRRADLFGLQRPYHLSSGPLERSKGVSREPSALGYVEHVDSLLMRELDQVRAILARVVM
jgi:hypothetical protein